MHNESKIVLGGTRSSYKVVTSKKGSVAAGLITHAKSDGTVSILAADGEIEGVSIGEDLSKAGYTSSVNAGLKVPVRATAGLTPVEGAQAFCSATTGMLVDSAAVGAVGLNAKYARSGLIKGIPEDGTAEVDCALIDFVGGL